MQRHLKKTNIKEHRQTTSNSTAKQRSTSKAGSRIKSQCQRTISLETKQISFIVFMLCQTFTFSRPLEVVGFHINFQDYFVKFVEQYTCCNRGFVCFSATHYFIRFQGSSLQGRCRVRFSGLHHIKVIKRCQLCVDLSFSQIR